MKVLVAEDDAFLSDAYRAKLEKSGFEVTMVGDGEEAMKALDTLVPDIILLDLVMPRKDGFATLTDIRARAPLKGVPVIVASNLGQKQEMERAKQLGANDYIVKSDLSMDDLVGRIQKVIADNKPAGFSLLAIIIVIAILGALLAIVLVALNPLQSTK